MRKNILHVFVFTLFVFTFAGCQRELQDPDGNSPDPPGNPTVNDNIMVQASVSGIVIDERNIPVKGATVTSGSQTTTTDQNGSFEFKNISFSKSNGNVKVSKPGYFTGVRSFISVAGRTHNVRVKLLPKTNSGNFNSTSGGTINAIGGARLTMPANAVADANGVLYTGTVNVAMIWIDPTSSDLPFVVPGDLRGITTGGDERGLETFGMIGVELTGSTGQPLNIAAGKKAELSFPIPTPLQADAPATIDLWHFDEQKARWMQDGTATKNGNNYIGNVSHFSFWSANVQFPVVDLCLRLLNAGGAPLNNVLVIIQSAGGACGYGRTDAFGSVCGKVPKDQVLLLKVYSQCYTAVISQNIGPFSSNADLGDITVNVPATQMLLINGTLVNCSNTNVTNGMVKIYTSDAHLYNVPVTNGTFSLPVLRCDNGTLDFSVLGIDNDNVQQSLVVTSSGTTGIVNVGQVQACGNSSAEFIDLMINSTPYNFTTPPNNIYVLDSSSSTQSTYHLFLAYKGSYNNPYSQALLQFAYTGTTGPAALWRFTINDPVVGIGRIDFPLNTYVNVTAHGAPGVGFVEGNFIAPATFNDGSTRTISCSFKIRRD